MAWWRHCWVPPAVQIMVKCKFADQFSWRISILNSYVRSPLLLNLADFSLEAKEQNKRESQQNQRLTSVIFIFIIIRKSRNATHVYSGYIFKTLSIAQSVCVVIRKHWRIYTRFNFLLPSLQLLEVIIGQTDSSFTSERPDPTSTPLKTSDDLKRPNLSNRPNTLQS